MRLELRLLAGVVAVVALGAAACGRTGPTVPSDPCATGACSAVPDLVGMTARQAWAALSDTAFVVPPELAVKGDDVTVDHQTPAAGTRAPATTAILLLFRSAPTPPPPAYAVSADDWAGIVQDPAAHTGERIVVYGRVEQVDATSGTPVVRARVNGVAPPVDRGAEVVLTGPPALLEAAAVGDRFRAEATVVSPPSAPASVPAVPQLDVTAITVNGKAG